jgi:hypothetical protein
MEGVVELAVAMLKGVSFGGVSLYGVILGAFIGLVAVGAIAYFMAGMRGK